jgi:hypothetical protein
MQHPEKAEELLSPTNEVCNLKIVLPSDSQTDSAGKKDRHLESSSNQQHQGTHPSFRLYCEQSENGSNSTNNFDGPDDLQLGEPTVDGLGTTRWLGREAKWTNVSPLNTLPRRTDETKRGEAPDLKQKSDAFEMSHPSKSKKIAEKGEASDLKQKSDAFEISHLDGCRCNERRTRIPEETERRTRTPEKK